MKKVTLFVLALAIFLSPLTVLATTETQADVPTPIVRPIPVPGCPIKGVPGCPIKGDVFRLGDVNMDGKVTLEDGMMLNDYLAGLIEFNSRQKKAAEVTSDGKINSFDMEAILAYARGDLPKLPIRFGDLNFDGQINWYDLSLILAYFQGRLTLDRATHFVADVYREGFINATDAYLIYAYMQGWVKELPVIPNYSR